MIAGNEQNKRFGFAAMGMWIEVVKRQRHKVLNLSVVPNHPESAESFYEKIGFKKTGVMENGEAVMRMDTV